MEPALVQSEITLQEGYFLSVRPAIALVTLVQVQVPITAPVVKQVPSFITKNVILIAQPHNISIQSLLLASLVTLPAQAVQLQAQTPV